jgi:hypothetical protein
MTGHAATVALSPKHTPYLEEELAPVTRDVRAGGYQVLERTLHVPAGLNETHLQRLADLLERRSLAQAPWPAQLRTELTGCARDEDVLAYLREQHLPHTVTDRLQWGPDPALPLRRACG